MNAVPLSVLDLATVTHGGSSAAALAETTELAKRADELGFHRFWVAEHHNLSTVASTSPSVLIAHLGANTTTIRLGSGGVMLPNHAPLAVAEQFALLEALYPDRIDLGVGRAPGTDQATARALRRGRTETEEDFPREFLDLIGLLGDVRTESGLWESFVATPKANSHPSVFLLGSSGFSAQLAGILGLPFVFANHFDMGGTESAIDLYRQRFEPSPAATEPYPIVSASVLVAETTEEAQRRSASSRLTRFGLRNGLRIPVYSPEEAANHEFYERAAAQPTRALYGTAAEVSQGLENLVSETGAAEIMLHLPAYHLAHRIETLEALAPQLVAR